MSSPKHILVLGAGLSSAWLIKYLAHYQIEENWTITLADGNLSQACEAARGYDNIKPVQINILIAEERDKLIAKSSIVLSLLPPALHIYAAKSCINYKIPLITASYVSNEMKKLNKKAEKLGVLLLNEMGLDPGIDHMSAMYLMGFLKSKGAKISHFKSYCGGLVAADSDTNPWHYKFTWNPMNVVTAGQSTAMCRLNGELCLVPPSRIFTQTESLGNELEAYMNRDSLGYIDAYQLQQAETVIRGTIRIKGFSAAWNILVLLGLTDNQVLFNTQNKTYKSLIQSLLPPSVSLEQFISDNINDPAEKLIIYEKCKWLGLESDIPLPVGLYSPAFCLLSLLKEKWKLAPNDHDRIIMIHHIGYQLNNKNYSIESKLEVNGSDNRFTAMAKTVGLPMAIAARLILKGKITCTGVQIPVIPEIYIPVLNELKKWGIEFSETSL